MKKKDLEELKTKTIEELNKARIDLIDEIGKIKTEVSQGKVKNTNSLKAKRKEMARVLTFLTMKNILSKTKVKEEAPVSA